MHKMNADSLNTLIHIIFVLITVKLLLYAVCKSHIKCFICKETAFKVTLNFLMCVSHTPIICPFMQTKLCPFLCSMLYMCAAYICRSIALKWQCFV